VCGRLHTTYALLCIINSVCTYTIILYNSCITALLLQTLWGEYPDSYGDPLTKKVDKMIWLGWNVGKQCCKLYVASRLIASRLIAYSSKNIGKRRAIFWELCIASSTYEKIIDKSGKMHCYKKLKFDRWNVFHVLFLIRNVLLVFIYERDEKNVYFTSENEFKKLLFEIKNWLKGQ
jgi:hypothetical protein